jgi:hypothetical protein
MKTLYHLKLLALLLPQRSSTTCSGFRNMLARAVISPGTKHSPLVKAAYIVHLFDNVSAPAEDQYSPFGKYDV